MPRLHEGQEVIATPGELDNPGVIESLRPWKDALKGCVLVKFTTSRHWMDPDTLRAMDLEDHRRIHGKRFCDWQHRVWYTLLFRYGGRSFIDTGISREELHRLWAEGWSEAAAVKRIAFRHGWELFSDRAPAYIRHMVVELGDELRATI